MKRSRAQTREEWDQITSTQKDNIPSELLYQLVRSLEFFYRESYDDKRLTALCSLVLRGMISRGIEL